MANPPIDVRFGVDRGKVDPVQIVGGVAPAYSHRFSPKKFTQHQLFACLVLKEFLKTDYRGLADILADCDSLRAAIELEHVPHFTTVQ